VLVEQVQQIVHHVLRLEVIQYFQLSHLQVEVVVVIMELIQMMVDLEVQVVERME
jgi:hypothetical protein